MRLDLSLSHQMANTSFLTLWMAPSASGPSHPSKNSSTKPESASKIGHLQTRSGGCIIWNNSILHPHLIHPKHIAQGADESTLAA